MDYHWIFVQGHKHSDKSRKITTLNIEFSSLSDLFTSTWLEIRTVMLMMLMSLCRPLEMQPRDRSARTRRLDAANYVRRLECAPRTLWMCSFDSQAYHAAAACVQTAWRGASFITHAWPKVGASRVHASSTHARAHIDTAQRLDADRTYRAYRAHKCFIYRCAVMSDERQAACA